MGKNKEKIKVFCVRNKDNEVESALEKKVNEWLEKNDITILRTLQSSSGVIQEVSTTVTLTIFYHIET